MSSKTIYTIAYNGYWEKHGKKWSNCINKIKTPPDEIIIVSDKDFDASVIKFDNVKKIIDPGIMNHRNVTYYRNLAISNSTSDWIIASDIDDLPMPNFLDNLNDSADVYGFSFFNKDNKTVYYPNTNSLNNRLLNIFDETMIPGPTAIKKHVFDKIRYEDNCHEDHVLFSVMSKLGMKVAADPVGNQYRFFYSGYHSKNKELDRVTDIYSKVLKENVNIYVMWFSKHMNDNRKKSLNCLIKKSGANVVIVNNNNFYNYENKELPIHRSFKYLTDVHKSDYARAYIMYFYGEGYSDLKSNDFEWNEHFDKLFTSNKTFIGYAEKNVDDIAKFYNNEQEFLFVNNNFTRFAGNGHYIFKPKSKFAYEWISEIHKILDNKSKQLEENPGNHPYLVNGGVIDSFKGNVDISKLNLLYPLEWNEICGRVFHRLQYKSNLNDQFVDMPYPNLKEYR